MRFSTLCNQERNQECNQERNQAIYQGGFNPTVRKNAVKAPKINNQFFFRHYNL